MGKNKEEILVKIMENQIKNLEHRIKAYNKFIEESKYENMLEDIVEINNQSNRWRDEHEMLFDFLYDTALEMVDFSENINIIYGEKTIRLIKTHGQGCFLGINVEDGHVHEDGVKQVNYNELIEYFKTKELPIRYKAIKAVSRAFEVLDVSHGNNVINIEGNKIDLHEVYNYIIKTI